MSSEPSPATVTFPAARRRFWSRAFGRNLGLATVALLSWTGWTASAFAVEGGPWTWALAVCLTMTSAIVAGLLAVRALAVRPGVDLRVEGDRVVLQSPWISRVPVTVLLSELRAIDVRPDGTRSVRAFLSTNHRVVALSPASFADPTDFEAFLNAISERVQLLSNGRTFAITMARRRELTIALLRRRAPVTTILLATCALWFVTAVLGDFAALESLWIGAGSGPLVRAGDWFRLVSAMFAHDTPAPAHLLFNGLALYALGNIIERSFGTSRFTVIFFGSGILASIASVLVNNGLVFVGSSGAIFGLLGAWVLLNMRYGAALPLLYHQPRNTWIQLAALNLIFPVAALGFGVQVDLAAHVAGLVAGLLLTWLVSDGPAVAPVSATGQDNTPRRTRSWSVVAAATGLAVVVLVAWTFVVAELVDRRDPIARLARVLVGNIAQHDGPTLNYVAWNLVTEARTTRSSLEVARRLASEAVTRVNERVAAIDRMTDSVAIRQALGLSKAAYLDTEAAIRFRLGEVESATQLQATAVRMSVGPWNRLANSWVRHVTNRLRRQLGLSEWVPPETPLPESLARLGGFVEVWGANQRSNGIGEAPGIDWSADGRSLTVDPTFAGARLWSAVSANDQLLAMVEVRVPFTRTDVDVASPAFVLGFDVASIDRLAAFRTRADSSRDRKNDSTRPTLSPFFVDRTGCAECTQGSISIHPIDIERLEVPGLTGPREKSSLSGATDRL